MLLRNGVDSNVCSDSPLASSQHEITHNTLPQGYHLIIPQMKYTVLSLFSWQPAYLAEMFLGAGLLETAGLIETAGLFFEVLSNRTLLG